MFNSGEAKWNSKQNMRKTENWNQKDIKKIDKNHGQTDKLSHENTFSDHIKKTKNKRYFK